MENITNEQMMAMVALVAALLQTLKSLPLVTRYRAWLPVVSVALGILLAYLNNMPEPIIPGIMIGLSASGSYSFMKSKNMHTDVKIK